MTRFSTFEVGLLGQVADAVVLVAGAVIQGVGELSEG